MRRESLSQALEIALRDCYRRPEDGVLSFADAHMHLCGTIRFLGESIVGEESALFRLENSFLITVIGESSDNPVVYMAGSGGVVHVAKLVRRGGWLVDDEELATIPPSELDDETLSTVLDALYGKLKDHAQKRRIEADRAEELVAAIEGSVPLEQRKQWQDQVGG